MKIANAQQFSNAKTQVSPFSSSWPADGRTDRRASGGSDFNRHSAGMRIPLKECSIKNTCPKIEVTNQRGGENGRGTSLLMNTQKAEIISAWNMLLKSFQGHKQDTRAFCQTADTPRYDLRIFSKLFEPCMRLPSVLLPVSSHSSLLSR